MHLDVLRCLAVKPAMVRICGKASELHTVSHTWLQFANDGVEAMRRFGDSMGVISAVNWRMESSGHPSSLIHIAIGRESRCRAATRKFVYDVSVVSEGIAICVLDYTSIPTLGMTLGASLATCIASVSIPGTLNILYAFHVTDVATCHGCRARTQTCAWQAVLRVSA